MLEGRTEALSRAFTLEWMEILLSYYEVAGWAYYESWFMLGQMC